MLFEPDKPAMEEEVLPHESKLNVVEILAPCERGEGQIQMLVYSVCGGITRTRGDRLEPGKITRRCRRNIHSVVCEE
jgi:hypothetical protein